MFLKVTDKIGGFSSSLLARISQVLVVGLEFWGKMSGLASRYGKRSGPERKTAPAIHGKEYWGERGGNLVDRAQVLCRKKIPVSKEVQR